ncbi:hypothetical protein UlMin_005191 [Ulmus minor]
MGNNIPCQIVGIDNISIRMFDGSVKILSGVRHVPNLHRNLISIGALDESEFVSRFEDGMIKISRGSLVIMKGLKENGLYVLQGSTITGEAAAAIPNIQDKTDLWHKRLGHISEKGLDVLKKQGAFSRDTISKVTFCEHCVLGKHHRLSFKTGVHKTNGALEYIHADLWGPAKTQTQGESTQIEVEQPDTCHSSDEEQQQVPEGEE